MADNSPGLASEGNVVSFSNVLAAIWDFNEILKRYSRLLEAQEQRLAERDYAAVQVLALRGDYLAEQIQKLGWQLMNTRRALTGAELSASMQYGEGAQIVLDKIDELQRRSVTLSSLAADFAEHCFTAQKEAMRELARYDILINEEGSPGSGSYVSTPWQSRPRPLIIDTVS